MPKELAETYYFKCKSCNHIYGEEQINPLILSTEGAAYTALLKDICDTYQDATLAHANTCDSPEIVILAIDKEPSPEFDMDDPTPTLRIVSASEEV